MRDSVLGLSRSDELSMLSHRRRCTHAVKVEMMDGDIIDIDVDGKARGAELLDKVCDAVDLVEKDYFGLLHEQRGDTKVWVDLNKRLSKTFKNEPWEVRFAVKFHPPEPSELQEDLTRYQLKLAIRRDLLEGRLPCSSVTHALLASYMLQSELGDYDDAHAQVTPGNLAGYALAPSAALTPDLEEKILELYKKHKGQTPAEAELNYLENAKKLAMYGVDLHPARDSEAVDICIGICASGVSVYRETLLMNRFPWAKVLKLSYKKRVFTLRLRAGDCDEYEIQLGFRLASTRAASKLWRAAVESHIFFRRTAPVTVARVAGFPRLGSRRTSCRSTLHQLRCAPTQRGTPPHLYRSLLVR